MIRETNEKPKPGEIKAFAFAISHPMPIDKKGEKAMKATAEFASKLDGLLGVNVQVPFGTLLIFKTVNDAKRAKNRCEAAGIKTGKDIVEIFVEKKYLKPEDREIDKAESEEEE